MTPDSSMTFADLRLRLAERVRLVQQDSAQRVVARTTEPDRTRLNNAINDGVREFMAFVGPVMSSGRAVTFAGWEWAKAQFSVEITQEAGGYTAGFDPSVVTLPPIMASRPISTVAFKRTGSTVDGGDVQLRHPAEIASRHAIDSSSSGYPCFGAVAFNPAARASLGSRGCWELRVWPKPDNDYTISFAARVQPQPFTQDDERGIWPQEHDLTVVACAVYCFQLADKPSGDPAVREARDEMGRKLAQSAMLDIRDYMNPTGGRLTVEAPMGRPYRITNADGSLVKAGVSYA
jgi:hypothetical protein